MENTKMTELSNIKIENVAKITLSYYRPDREEVSFTVRHKNGDKDEFNYRTFEEGTQDYLKLIHKYNEYNEHNNITEYYQLMNDAHAVINGQFVLFGCRCDSWLRESKLFTLLEIEKLRKEFKIRDNGIRQMAFITMLEIKGTKVVRGELTEAYKEQLIALGYNVDLLEN